MASSSSASSPASMLGGAATVPRLAMRDAHVVHAHTQALTSRSAAMLDEPPSPEQLRVLLAILDECYNPLRSAASVSDGMFSDGAAISLLDVLRAYEAVLPRTGIAPAEDTYFYRFLLAISMMNPVSVDAAAWTWYDRMAAALTSRGHALPPTLAARCSVAHAVVDSEQHKAMAAMYEAVPEPAATASTVSYAAPSPAHTGARSPPAVPRLATTALMDATRLDGMHSSMHTSALASSRTSVQHRVIHEALETFRRTARGETARPADTVEGSGALEEYVNFRRMARAFRAWVAGVVYVKEERTVTDEINEIKVAAARSAHRARQLQTAWRGLVLGTAEARRERVGIIRAVEHWSIVTLRNVFKSWRAAIAAERPQPLYHPQQIRALFHWIACTLPDRGEWWRLAAAHADATQVSPADGPMRTPAASRRATPSDNAHAASAWLRRNSFAGFEYEAVTQAALGASPHVADLDDGYARDAAVLSASIATVPLLGRAPPSILAGSVLTAARLRDERLGRLRAYLLGRIAPPIRRLPLLEHATAIVDAHQLLRVFVAWRQLSHRIAAKRQRHEQQRVYRCWAAWREFARGSSHRGRAFVTVQRMRVRVARFRALVAWQRAVAEEHFVRDNAVTAAVQYGTWLLRRGFDQWRSYLAHIRRLRVRAQFTQRALLVDVFRSWRQVALLQRRLSAAAARVRSSIEQHVRRGCVRAWRAEAYLAARERAASRAILLRKGVRGWQRRARLLRLSRIVVHQWRHSALLHALGGWRTYVATARVETSAADAAYGRLLRRAALQRWHAELQRLRGLRNVIERWRSVAVRRSFAGWMAYVTARRVMRERGRNVVLRLIRHKELAALQHWRVHAQQSRALSAHKVAVAARVSQRKRAAHLQLWRSELHHRQQLQAVLRRWMNMQLTRSVHTWRSRTRTRVTNRARILALLQRMQGSVLAKAFNSLRANVANSHRSRELASRLVLQWPGMAARRMLRSWRDIAKDSRKKTTVAERALRRLRLLSVAKCFASWAAFLGERKAQKQMMRRVVAGFQHGRLAACVRTWREAVSNSKRTRRIMQHAAGVIRNARTHGCILMWLEYTREQRGIKRRMQRVVDMMMNGALQRAVNTWRAVTKCARQQQHVARRVIQHLQNIHVARAVLTWRDWAAHAKELRRVARHAMARFMQVGTARAFQSWRQFVVQRRDERKAMLRVVATLRDAVTLRLIYRWRDVASARAANRRLLPDTVRRMQQQNLAAAWRSWCTLVEHRLGQAEAAAAHAHAHVLRQARGVFQSWRSLAKSGARVRRTARSVLARWRAGTLTRVLSTWRSWAGNRVADRDAAAVADAHWTALRRNWCLRTWTWHRQYHLRGRTCANLMSAVSTRAQTRLALREWRAASREVTAAQKLQLRALAWWTQRSVAATFHAWVAAVRLGKDERRRMRACIERLRLSAAINAVHVWQHWTAARLSARQTVRRMLLHGAGRAVRTWWAWAQERRRLIRARTELVRRVLQAARFGTQARVFHAWSSWALAAASRRRGGLVIATECRSRIVRHHLRAWMAVLRAQQLCTLRVTRLALFAWQRHHQRASTARQLASRLAARSQRRVLRAGVAAALEERATLTAATRLTAILAASPAAARALVQRAVYAWRGAPYMPAWRAWLALTQGRIRQRRAAALVQAAVIRTDKRLAWHAWRRALTVTRVMGHIVALDQRSLLRHTFTLLKRGVAIARERRSVKRDAAVRALVFWRHRHERIVLQAWRGWTHQMRAAKQEAARWFLGHQQLSVRHAWSAWCEHVQRCRAVKRAAAAFLAQTDRGRMEAAMHAWHARVQHTRMVKGQCIAFFRLHGCRAAIASWRTWCENRRFRRDADMRAAVARLGFVRRELQRVWAAWRGYVSVNRGTRTVMMRVAERIRNARVGNAVAVWRHYTSEVQRRRVLITAALQRMRHVGEARALACWRAWAQRRRAHAYRAATVTRQGNAQLRLRTWRTWRGHFSSRQLLRARIEQALQRTASRSLHAAWQRWSGVVEAARQHSARMLEAALAFQHSTLKRSVQTWRAVSADSSRMKRLAALAVQRWRLGAVDITLQAWRRYASRRAALGRLGTRIQMLAALSSQRRALQALGVAFHESRRLHVATAAVARLQRARMLRERWEEWRELASGLRLERLAASRWVATAAQRALQVWKFRSALQRFQRRLADRHRTLALTTAVDAWKRAVQQQRMEQLHTTQQARRRRVMLLHWRHRAVQRRDVRVASMRATGKLSAYPAVMAVRRWRHWAAVHAVILRRRARDQHRALTAMFSALVAYAVSRQTKRLRVSHAAAAIQHGCAARVMQAWRSVVVASREYRVHLETQAALAAQHAQEAARRRRHALQAAFSTWRRVTRIRIGLAAVSRRFQLGFIARPSFAAWHALAARRATFTALSERVLRSREVRTQRRALQEWRVITASVIREHEQEVIAEQRAIAARKLALDRCFHGWARLVKRRAAHERAADQLEARRMATVLQRWCVAATAEAAYRRRYRHAAFRAWQHHAITRRQQRHRALLIAASRQTVRRARRVMSAWKIFVAAHQAQRELLTHASAYLLAARAALSCGRAVRLWRQDTRVKRAATATTLLSYQHASRRAVQRMRRTAQVVLQRQAREQAAGAAHAQRVARKVFTAWRGLAAPKAFLRMDASRGPGLATVSRTDARASPATPAYHESHPSAALATPPSSARSTRPPLSALDAETATAARTSTRSSGTVAHRRSSGAGSALLHRFSGGDTALMSALSNTHTQRRASSPAVLPAPIASVPQASSEPAMTSHTPAAAVLTHAAHTHTHTPASHRLLTRVAAAAPTPLVTPMARASGIALLRNPRLSAADRPPVPVLPPRQ